MKVLMIGTPSCVKCKQIAPSLEDYCKDHNIEFNYLNVSEASPSILDILVSKGIQQAPAFLISRPEETIVLSGDNIFLELESLQAP